MLQQVASALGALAILATSASAYTLHHTYRFDPASVQITGPTGAALLRAETLPHTWELGQPEIPYDIVTLLVPQGSRLVGLRVEPSAEVVLGRATLQHARPIANTDGRLLEPRPARLAPEKGALAGALYPALQAEPAGGGALHGYQIVSVRVYPVRYDAATGRVLANRTLDLQLDLEPGGGKPVERQRYSPDIEADARRSLEHLVANPEQIDAYDRRLGLRVDKVPGGFHPSVAPSLEGSPVRYVIVTTDALAASWQVLADWKTRRGVPTVVRTVEWIQSNYRHGSDLQETIRTFIKDAYAKWGVQYVLLGGDTDILPARYGFSAFGEPTEQDIPTDTYFACLDGNWNKNGNGLWGEAALSASDPGDSTDFYAEVYIGRSTASTTTKVSAFVAKLMAYENPTQTAYQNRVLSLAEVLFPVDWDSGQSISMDGGSFAEEMAGYVPGCVTVKKMYQNYPDYPGAVPLSRDASIAEMNTGYGLVNHIGHGFRYNMSLGDLSMLTGQAQTLTNTDKRFVLYFLNCTATAFDFPCLAEAFLESNGGAIAVLGASRAAYALPSRNYNRGFFQAVYQNGYAHLGQAFVQSRIAQTPNTWYDTADHYSHLLYNFLGDPETVMHTCGLGATVASYPASIGLGLTNVTVHVTVGGAPKPGALVCLQKGTEEYVYGTADASGTVSLDFRAESAGSVQVTASGQNMTTHLGSLSVTTGGVAYVHDQTLAIDDNSSGGSAGNNDAVLDAGETLQLNATFVNDGSASASSPSGILRVPSPWVSVLDSTYSLSTVSANGGTATSTGQVLFLVSSNTPDGTVLPLTFRTTSGATTWVDVVNKVVHAPRMELTYNKISDYAPGGNNDGIIQAGETFDLLVYFENYGTGAADGCTVSLATSSPNVQLATSSTSLGRVTPLQEATPATHLRLQETALAENAITLTLTDSYARNQVRSITLRGPAKPGTPALDATTGANVVVAVWQPSTEADLAGYYVYRALASGGPWSRVQPDHNLNVAYLRDTGLAASTKYYYYVTAQDTTGNESIPSNVSSINTNPAQLSGWPINLGASSSCPLAVGDVTGDGSKEIVAGNIHLYAWDWHGIELRDDDNDPQTWGIFSIEMQTVTGAVALAQLDRQPGYEIFATSWDDSNRAYAFKGDGSILPGWPRDPDYNSVPHGYWGSSAAMDVDGDGRAEVFAPAKNGNLYAWHYNGSPLGTTDAFKSGLGTYARCSPTFARLDASPYPEIVYGTPTGILNVWKPDGSNFGTFPKTLGTLCLSNTAIGDVNHDGILDIVMLTEGGSVHVLNSKTGNELSGWPRGVPMKSNPVAPSPALADFNFDGYLEIVVANNDYSPTTSSIRIFDYLGNTLPGWPKVTGSTSESSPIVADFSGDGIPDILFGGEAGLLYGWDKNGNEIAGFPLSVNDFIRSTPFADDVDGDGRINLVLSGWDKNVYVWDFPAPFVKVAAQWPTLKHDVQRTGYYKFRDLVWTDVVPEPVQNAPPRAWLAQNEPNPFNPLTSISYAVPVTQGKAQSDVRLDVYDVGGRHVRTLLSGSLPPGNYKTIWDGRDDRGAQVESGVYFYRLQAGGESQTRKMLMLK